MCFFGPYLKNTHSLPIVQHSFRSERESEEGIFVVVVVGGICVKRAPFVKLTFLQQNGAFFGPKKGFSAISHYKNSDDVGYSIWATFLENVVRNHRNDPFWTKKTCTVSPQKRQFDKWYPFHAPAGGGGWDRSVLLAVRSFFLLTVGLCCLRSFGLVFSSLRLICLWWKIGLVFFAYGSPRQEISETGRIWFRGVRFQTPNSVSFTVLTEFQRETTPWVLVNLLFLWKSELTEFAPKLTELAQNPSEFSLPKTVLSKQYSARFPTLDLVFSACGSLRGPMWLDDRVSDNGNKWEEVPRRTSLAPLRPLVLYFVYQGWKQKGFWTTREGGDHVHCTVERSPDHIRCRSLTVSKKTNRKHHSLQNPYTQFLRMFCNYSIMVLEFKM